MTAMKAKEAASASHDAPSATGRRRGGVVTLPDGRSMAYGDYGAPDGIPLIGMHGTPGSRLMFSIADAQARDLGIRLLAPERPGFGISSYHRGRTLASFARDTAIFADRLGIGRFAVAGISGGGPYATACAALLPDRVTSLGLVSPVGPVMGAEGAPRIGPGHHVLFRVSPNIPPLIWPLFAIGRAAFLYAPIGMYGFILSRSTPSDWKILTRPEVRTNLLAGVAEGLRPGVKAGLQEMALFSRPWDIPFAAITAPTILWQGTADRNVPPSAAFRLGELIPGCEVNTLPGAGHYWIFDNIRAVLARIVAAERVGPAASLAGSGARQAEPLH